MWRLKKIAMEEVGHSVPWLQKADGFLDAAIGCSAAGGTHVGVVKLVCPGCSRGGLGNVKLQGDPSEGWPWG